MSNGSTFSLPNNFSKLIGIIVLGVILSVRVSSRIVHSSLSGSNGWDKRYPKQFEEASMWRCTGLVMSKGKRWMWSFTSFVIFVSSLSCSLVHSNLPALLVP